MLGCSGLKGFSHQEVSAEHLAKLHCSVTPLRPCTLCTGVLDPMQRVTFDHIYQKNDQTNNLCFPAVILRWKLEHLCWSTLQHCLQRQERASRG